MQIEERLASIDDTLKQILVCLMSGSSAVAQLGEPETKPAAKPRGKKADAEVLPGHAAGTTYWINMETGARWIRQPDDESDTAPFTQVTAAAFSAKEEDAKKSSAAAAKKLAADTKPTATAQQGAASNNSEPIVFKAVVDKLQQLAKREGGRDQVMGILNKHLESLPAAERKVPKLEALNINAALISEIGVLLGEEPAAAIEFDPFA